MSKITLAPNAAGTATFTVAAPNTSTDRTLTLPDASGTLAYLQRGVAQASTSGTLIDFTGIPANAKRVTVMFAGVSTSSASRVLVRAGTGGLILASGYTGVTGTITGTNTTTTEGFTSGIIAFDPSSLQTWNAVVTLCNITGNSWVVAGSSSYAGSYASTLAGTFTLSGALDTIRITTSNGTDTFDAGTVNIMWEG